MINFLTKKETLFGPSRRNKSPPRRRELCEHFNCCLSIVNVVRAPVNDFFMVILSRCSGRSQFIDDDFSSPSISFRACFDCFSTSSPRFLVARVDDSAIERTRRLQTFGDFYHKARGMLVSANLLHCETI